jgi:hypothetical protein
MTDEEYIKKYQEKYGKLDDKGIKHVLESKDLLSNNELEKLLNEWVEMNTISV